MPFTVASRRHPLVVACREARGGGDDQPLLLDGWHLLLEAMRSPRGVDAVLIGAEPPGADERAALAALVERGAQVVEVSADVLHAASPVRTPSGVVALARRPASSLDRVFARRRRWSSPPSTFRIPATSARWSAPPTRLAPAALVAVGGSADPLGWKALRASMGSAFRLPVTRVADAARVAGAEARGHGLQIVVLEPGRRRAARRPSTSPARPASCSAARDTACRRRCWPTPMPAIRLPMRPPVESLNVAVAGALVLYAAAAQREGRR